jgi:hypothetical protein
MSLVGKNSLTRKQTLASLNILLLHYYPISYRLLSLVYLVPRVVVGEAVRLLHTSLPLSHEKPQAEKKENLSDQVQASEVNADDTSLSDLEWNSLSLHTQKIALLAWKKRELVPKDFLSNADHRERYLNVQEIYEQIKSEPGFRSSEDPKFRSIKDIPVNSDYADTHDYIVEDPSNPGQALYLDQDEYTRLQNTCISNKKRLRTIKSPGFTNNLKFPPRPGASYRSKWLNSKYKEVQPFIQTDLFSWASYINPSIATQDKLAKTRPSTAPLAPRSPITRATGQIVRYWSTLQAITTIYKLNSELSWLLVSMGLVFMSQWYYSSLAHTCSIFKEAKRLLLKYLAGTPELVSRGVVLSIDKHGLPRIIPAHVRILIRSGHEMAIKVTLLGLDTPKMFVYLGADNTDTIVQPSTAVPRTVHVFGSFSYIFEIVLSSLYGEAKVSSKSSMFIDYLSTLTSELSCLKLFFTSKAGPNGHALLSSPLDAIALLTSPARKHIELYCESIQCSGFYAYIIRVGKIAQSFYGLLLDSAETISDLQRYSPVEGRISRVYTAYGKCRLVAIPTYFVQVLFRPLHLLIFSIFRHIPTDSTFDQQAGARRVVETGGKHLRSFDLSAATDRLPLSIQTGIVYLLAKISGLTPAQSAKLSQAWTGIIQNTLFRYTRIGKRNMPVKSRDIKYGCGHPMGTYSSWAAFSLTHHLIIQFCAYLVLLNKYRPEHPDALLSTPCDETAKSWLTHMLTNMSHTSFKKMWYMRYQMLGDDVVFFANTSFERAVSDLYLDLMPLLGVSIHPSKGFDSTNGSFEFAKMFIRDGKCLNDLRWGEWAGQYQPGMVVNAARQAIARNFELSDLKTFVIGVIGLIPSNIEKKLSHFLRVESFWDKTFLSLSKEDPYLLCLVLRLNMSVYQVSIHSWVSYCMGTAQLPCIEYPTSTYAREYFRIDRILELISLVIAGPPKMFKFIASIDNAIISTIFSFFKKRVYPWDTGDKHLSEFRRRLRCILLYTPLGFAFFLTHPILLSIDSSSASFDDRNREDLEIGYESLEYSPELALEVDRNIKNCDVAELDKIPCISYNSDIKAIKLCSTLCTVYHMVNEGTDAVMTDDSLDFNIQSFVNCIRPFKMAIHTECEKHVNAARSAVATWVYPSMHRLLLTDGSAYTFAAEYFGIETVYGKLSKKPFEHLKPSYRDILSYDPYGVPTFFNDEIVSDALKALKEDNMTMIVDISNNNHSSDFTFGTGTGFPGGQQVVVCDDSFF